MHCKRLICILLCAITVCLTAAVSGQTLSVGATSISEYKDKLAAAQAESAKLKSQINQLKKKNAPYEEQKAALKKQIAATQNEIDIYNEQIAEANASIKKRQAELDETKDMFKKRLVAMYTSGNNSELSVLLSAQDFSDYLAKAELMRSIADYDSALIEQINNAITEINESKAVLDEAKQSVSSKQAELTEQYNAVNAIVTDAQEQINSLNDKLESQKEMEADIAAAIKREQQAQQSSGSSGSSGGSGSSSAIKPTGQFTWPVPGFYTLSSRYGYRWGRLHAGIDISSGGIYGARIVAADSGKVTLSKYYSGYGYCVMIDHGNGYTTLYAHMKQASTLGVGKYVAKGATVGYVGSSGNSTGPHLHFEIRKNGSTVNPMNFF